MQNPDEDDIAGDVKLVLDTDVIVAGIRSTGGASAELLRLARQERFKLVLSVPILLEYEAVALRPEHLAASGLSAVEVGTVLDVLTAVAERTSIHFRYRPLTRDPADELMMEAAVNAGAQAIVTFNRRDFRAAADQMKLGCWLPREALEKLR